ILGGASRFGSLLDHTSVGCIHRYRDHFEGEIENDLYLRISILSINLRRQEPETFYGLNRSLVEAEAQSPFNFDILYLSIPLKHRMQDQIALDLLVARFSGVLGGINLEDAWELNSILRVGILFRRRGWSRRRGDNLWGTLVDNNGFDRRQIDLSVPFSVDHRF